jgi:hypothetical protein
MRNRQRGQDVQGGASVDRREGGVQHVGAYGSGWGRHPRARLRTGHAAAVLCSLAVMAQRGRGESAPSSWVRAIKSTVQSRLCGSTACRCTGWRRTAQVAWVMSKSVAPSLRGESGLQATMCGNSSVVMASPFVR